MIRREIGHQESGPFSENDLKICDLCGALNLEINRECFVCGWHGRFERRPEVVRVAMEIVKRRHGSLELQLLTDVHTHHSTPPLRLGARLRRFFLRLHHWLFG